jgi:hypothetical protein
VGETQKKIISVAMGLGAVGCIPAREFEESAPLLWLAEIEICSDWLNQAIAREKRVTYCAKD